MNYNNYYQNPYQPVTQMQQPRLDYTQFNQQQFAQPQVQQNIIPHAGINGRIVDDINTVSINEVSADNNNPSVFLKNDLSEMYLKRYTPNGLIQTFTYKLQIDEDKTDDENSSKPWSEAFNSLQAQLNSIDDKLNKALSVSNQGATKPRTLSKKEVTAQ